ncbi:hypothetical protein ACHWGL_30495, partial [Klebsiella pneumoniae]|uniref:hypothetical protein n=1 Tax=Klebsiella pneumoniae TaxID=573 RepID=UPI00376EF592
SVADQTPSFKVKNARFGGYTATSSVGIDLDASLPAATYGEVSAFKEFTYRENYSLVEGASVLGYAAQSAQTAYGCIRNSTFARNGSSTAAYNLKLSRYMRATGTGSD